ncbi:hypothetical protein PV433_22890, partial [Paenibacillus sp. GYB004]|uniref:hypothetical protein n=1 Tax=Paenibacillus sp. GYB004 TaxID=2994393 RepID=UPI002F96655C
RMNDRDLAVVFLGKESLLSLVIPGNRWDSLALRKTTIRCKARMNDRDLAVVFLGKESLLSLVIPGNRWDSLAL